MTESELWDVKETLAMWCAEREDREAKVIKFAEIIAAFANKRGGVLLIGITNKTHEVVGVDDAENRIKDIEARLRECIGPQLDFVRTRAVPISDGTGRSCIVVVVGQTDKPMSVRQKNNSYSYPLRVGPGIERVTPEQIWTAKAHMKGTNFSFASELEAWVSDVE